MDQESDTKHRLTKFPSPRDQAASSAQAQDRQFRETKALCQQILSYVEKAGGVQNSAAQGVMTHELPRESHALPIDDAYGKESSARVQRLILQSLHYRELDHRYERITQAYRKTFQWIYQQSSLADFSVWLRDTDASFYWITGKPGSGKSTLMKFIQDHDRTQVELKAGLAGRPSIIASAYLWNSGTQKQMSYEGLVQNLLYQLLRADPALIRTVFSRWLEAGMILGNLIERAGTMVWVWEDLNRAFRSVLAAASKTHKIIVFIDGLDEFAGKPVEIIAFVDSLLSQGVKICASSRPWVAFEDAFERYPHFRVQDLTRGDIKHYATSQLEQNEGFKAMKAAYPDVCDELVKNVCEKSSGVFLWVVLVTASLLEGLTDGETGVELRARLDNLPEDLENLFWKILRDLDSRNYPRACQLFQIHRFTQTTLTLFDMSFADNLDGDPDFAMRAPFGKWDESKKNARAILMRRRMTAACKGMLEANKAEREHPFRADIGYLHRTVKDFLEQNDVWSEICRAAGPDFNYSLSLYNAQLMRLKSPAGGLPDLKNTWEMIILAIVYALRAAPQGSKRQIEIFAELDLVIGQAMTGSLSSHSGTRGSYLMFWRSGSESHSSFLALAVRLQLTEYVSACLEDMMESTAKSEASWLLYTAVTSYEIKEIGMATLPAKLTHDRIGRKMVQLLLVYADPNWRSRDGTTAWSKLLETPNLDQSINIILDFLEAGADPRHPILNDPDFKSRLPEALRTQIKQKRRSSRFTHYFGSSGRN